MSKQQQHTAGACSKACSRSMEQVHALAFSAENPETTVMPFGGGARIVTDDNTVPDLTARYNWKGDIGSPYPANRDIHCSRHNTLSVLADGRVPLCCMDQLGTYQLGDANTSPLFYIYNSPRAVAYRSRTKRHSEPCNRCNVS